ncbi:MAG: beta-ketoacyl-[acyl-carrier-protein] synthase family protein [Bryobacteraceae bacterium]|nr:beta-ketoacyl-[acyl-carrier-protein] synthase family protein [Bryobacteraceae bacterium]
MSRRVAVTGLGMVCALGGNVDEARKALFSGRPGIGPVTLVNPDLLKIRNGAEARAFNPDAHFEAKEQQLLDRFAQLALAAAAEAIADAGLTFTGGLGARTAIVTGTSAAGQTTVDDASVELYRHNAPRLNPLTIPRTMSNAAASHISMKYGIAGPAWTVSTACSSSNHAIGQAFWMVRHGLADCAIAGGSEAPFNLGFLKSWEAMRVLSPDTCRPFSKERKGLILGEGAGFLVIEPLEAARARGASILGEIAGFGMSADAHHITMPSPEGAAAAMRAALENAGLPPEAIGYINAHGTGTSANDPTETQAIRAAFGPAADRLAVSSTKSMHGHALGAAGALEAVATILALRDGILPPTANFLSPDPECDLDVIPNQPRAARVEAALSNSFAFGGLNAVLVFKAPAAP